MKRIIVNHQFQSKNHDILYNNYGWRHIMKSGKRRKERSYVALVDYEFEERIRFQWLSRMVMSKARDLRFQNKVLNYCIFYCLKYFNVDFYFENDYKTFKASFTLKKSLSNSCKFILLYSNTKYNLNCFELLILHHVTVFFQKKSRKVLENFFESKTDLPTNEDNQMLAKKSGLTKKQVLDWFRNRRHRKRQTEKKEKNDRFFVKKNSL